MGLVYEPGAKIALSQEWQLIKRCKAGDREAFNEIIGNYQKKVINIAYHFLGNYTEAIDLTQDAFIRAYLSIRRFRQDSSFYTWLYRITVNLCKNRLKYRKRHGFYQKRSLDEPLELEEGSVRLDLATGKPSPRESLESKEKISLIRQAIDSLEETQRTVLILRDREMMRYEEIARVLKCEVGTVKSRLHRAREILKEKLKGVL